MTLRAFKCPFCGYRFRVDPEGKYVSGEILILRSHDHKPGDAEEPRRVDLTCLNCGQEFEVQVEDRGLRWVRKTYHGPQ